MSVPVPFVIPWNIFPLHNLSLAHLGRKSTIQTPPSLGVFPSKFLLETIEPIRTQKTQYSTAKSTSSSDTSLWKPGLISPAVSIVPNFPTSCYRVTSEISVFLWLADSTSFRCNAVTWLLMLVSKYRQVHYLTTASNNHSHNIIRFSPPVDGKKDLHYNLAWVAFDTTKLTFLERCRAGFLVSILVWCREIWHYQHCRG